jgi:hypothetical protein
MSNCRSIRVRAVYTELHRSHDPQFFLVRGVIKRTTEQPKRADRLLAGLKAGKHSLVEPTVFGQGPRARVHSAEYLRFLEEAWDAWVALGDSGSEMIANIHPVRYGATYPTHIVGRLGWHAADTAAPDQQGHLRRRLCRHRCRHDRGATRHGRRRRCLCAVPAAGPSRLCRHVGRLLFLQQQRGGSGAASAAA